MSTPTPQRCLNEADASLYLGISRSTLRQARMHGDRRGRIVTPPYVRLGSRRIGYLRDDLDRWLESCRSAAPQRI